MTAKKGTTKENLFDTLMRVDVSKHTYQKDTGKVSLTYLQWAWAYSYMMYIDPKAKVEFSKFDEYDWNAHKPTGRKINYMDTGRGAYVQANVTIKGITKHQLLPVMDYKNNAPQNFNLMQVNKAHQRAFVKCLALFGLGLSLYGMKSTVSSSKRRSNGAGRKSFTRRQNQSHVTSNLISEKQAGYLKGLIKQTNSDGTGAYKWLENNYHNLNTMSKASATKAIKYLNGLKAKQKRA